MRIFLSIFILTFVISCKDNDTEIYRDLAEGTYTGIFARTSPTARYPAADITLKLKDGQFSGSSNMENYPAICEGTYSVSGNKISFENSCSFSADFDWSLVLDGQFEIIDKQQEIVLVKEEGEITDSYFLEKKE